jgi:UDP-4-amino-4,6-dideoxy-N-acetyl-beta-L-altrosamine N-acetyltransferase
MKNFCQNFDLSQASLINFINLNEDDKEIVRKWRNHPRVRKWMRTDDIIDRQEHLSFIERLRSDNKNFYWMGKSNNENIGVISLNNLDAKNRNAFLGVYANPDLKGVGVKLMAALKDLSFNMGHLHSLRLEVREENLNAIKFYQKSGFKQEGLLREVTWHDGKWHNAIIMGVVNEDAN